MLRTLDSRNLAYSFGPSPRPALEIDPGDTVVFQTVDARGGRAMRQSDEYTVPPPPPFDRLNPVTGPVFVRGARADDTLLVDIESIELGAKGYAIARQDMGVLQDMVRTPGAKVLEVRGGRVLFSDKISVPTRPMVGTIGVAPPGGSVASVEPGAHGGNMDCNDVAAGARVYLPVGVEGALLSLGDVHATMGDGEVSGGGLDIGADVKARIGVLKGVRVGHPLVETPTGLVVIRSAKRVEEAVRGVVESSVTMMMERIGLTFEDAFRMASIACDLRVCQACVSPLDVVVRMQIPKLFSPLGPPAGV